MPCITRTGEGREVRRKERQLHERELSVTREARHADADEPKCAGAIGESTVEQAAGELADLLRVVDADAQGGRAAPDREVRVPELRRDGARSPAAVTEQLGDSVRHPAQLGVQLLAIG